MKNLLLNIIKWCLYIVFIPIFWIYGFFWLLFASRSHSDKSISIHALLTIISVCICGAFIFRSPEQPQSQEILQEDLQAEDDILTQDVALTKTYHTNYKEPYTPAEIEAGYIDAILPVSYAIAPDDVPEETQLIQNTQPIYNEEPVVLQEIPVYIETPAITEEVPVYAENTYTDTNNFNNTNITSEENIVETIPSEDNNIPSTNDTPNIQMVWVDDTAPKYHSSPYPNHFKMDAPKQVTLQEALDMGKTACKKCY